MTAVNGVYRAAQQNEIKKKIKYDSQDWENPSRAGYTLQLIKSEIKTTAPQKGSCEE